jgi:hypothetical protein
MIFRWLKRRRELSARVSAEAETMIALFGDGAYYEGSSRALTAERRQARDSCWARVRREIARRTRRDHIDTATRYLEPDGRIRVWSRRQGDVEERQ